ncbi:MAG: metalloregulator ArsR/SmtB family transcription factor [Syntrophales bacterium]|nr:metalloregulator ArsR/SmtB family transcription factor [Syntrophales bacterium]
MRDFIKVMKALSDPNRVRIIKLLQNRVLCVCEIQELLGIAQSTVSKHLKLLEEVRLIDFSKDGLWVNYRLSDGSDNPYAAALLENLRGWLDDDPELERFMARLPQVDREAICRR